VADSTLTAAAALDAIEEGVLVHDSRQLVYANRAAGELLGVDRDDLRALADVAPPCQCVSESGTPLKDDEWPVIGVLRTGRPQRPRVLGIRQSNGAVRWLRVSARPYGRTVLTSLLDVTALRRAEEDAAALAARIDGGATGVLSPREHQVVELLAAGLTGDEVAERLGISPATVRVHIRNATGKLGASTRTQAVAIAVARGEVAAPLT